MFKIFITKVASELCTIPRWHFWSKPLPKNGFPLWIQNRCWWFIKPGCVYPLKDLFKPIGRKLVNGQEAADDRLEKYFDVDVLDADCWIQVTNLYHKSLYHNICKCLYDVPMLHFCVLLQKSLPQCLQVFINVPTWIFLCQFKCLFWIKSFPH